MQAAPGQEAASKEFECSTALRSPENTSLKNFPRTNLLCPPNAVYLNTSLGQVMISDFRHFPIAHMVPSMHRSKRLSEAVRLRQESRTIYCDASFILIFSFTFSFWPAMLVCLL